MGWGKLSIGGEVSGGSQSKHEVNTVTNFEMSFAVAQIPLVRAWFDPTFLESRAWRFSPNALNVSQLSDGGDPPKGMFIAYPTSVIFIRDININFDELHDEKSELQKQLKAKASGGWGPVKIGGSYERETHRADVEHKFDKRGLTMTGMQILGFRCHELKKSLDPLSTIQKWV